MMNDKLIKVYVLVIGQKLQKNYMHKYSKLVQIFWEKAVFSCSCQSSFKKIFSPVLLESGDLFWTSNLEKKIRN